MDLKLAGKIALVTGSSRGIGLATARACAAEGCRLMLSATDVAEPEDAAALIDAAVAAYGGIDILVNNVGGGDGGARIADSTDDDLDERDLSSRVEPV